MLANLVVAGGSSPFTPALINAIAASDYRNEPQRLVLFGRNPVNLELIRRFAEARLGSHGWLVSSTTSLESALDGAQVVLHQIRYGGLEGREEDERLAASHGLPADETIGPAGLQAAIRMFPDLCGVAQAICRYCPDAWILNLTNPLSLAVAVMQGAGVRRPIGLCELPEVTFREACGILALQPDTVDWSYCGLNHRGFIVRFFRGGADCLPALIESMGEKTIGGITAAEIAGTKAIPLKYFRLFRATAPQTTGRARALQALSHDIVDQLRSDASQPPAALGARRTDWYPHAVVPMLSALKANNGRMLTVNLVGGEDGIVVEMRARVFQDRLEPVLQTAAEGPVRVWMNRFVGHERAALAAVLDPSDSRIREAVRLDPLIPGEKVCAVTQDLSRMAAAVSIRNSPLCPR
jgi:6-phospho-beta-glucosidase